MSGCVGQAIAFSTAPAAEMAVLPDPAGALSASDVIRQGSRFVPAVGNLPITAPGQQWVRLRASRDLAASDNPVLVVHKARTSEVHAFLQHGSELLPLRPATEVPAFKGTHDQVFPLPGGVIANASLYLKVMAAGAGWSELRPTISTLSAVLARHDRRSRPIALAFGALTAMAGSALLIWLVLRDRLFGLYAGLFFLQGLYLVYLSGEGFDWPGLSLASPLGSHAWNIPAGLSGAVTCLFVRDLVNLKNLWPRIHVIYGWLAAGFVLITLANAAKSIGLGPLVNAVGNGLFLAGTALTIAVALLAWRRGSRAAGWFLIAWFLLAASTIATTALLLAHASEDAGQALYYFILPGSMALAAVLTALGVADHLRDQRLALMEARRNAQIDPLTGMLNRRSLIQHLDAASVMARARGLPISILFIDLDHFKLINDSFGHQAGDACLRAIMEPIQAELRQSDVVGRWGGEEFVVMLSGADAAAAHPIAERIRQRVQDTVVDGYGAPIRLTCSIGLAASNETGSWGEALIAQADAAVYSAKRAGRNQVAPSAT